ncbi:MAG TPA: SAM-dependent methyltransferase [Pyrinomonadaceae bacterium]|nr:SAM-dependent methyltransferase [Pyrinomonadaceae bacterium]
MGERVVEHSSIRPLAERLRERINREGAISFRDWMDAALYDEHEGYYCRRSLKRQGRAGDYRTSPERSALFAATFAGYLAARFHALGEPPIFTIYEAGAGEGLFAHGVLSTLRRDYPEVFSTVHYMIDERSADAREKAREHLAMFKDRIEFRRLSELSTPSIEGIIFSNELLDAFPVHLVAMRGGNLYELCVGLSETGKFQWVEREPTTPRLAGHFTGLNVSLAEGQIAEVNLAASEWITRAASIVRRGFVITVDYGAESAELYATPHRCQGTLRAFRRHRFAEDVLNAPGTQDLTTTINWAQIKREGERAGLRTVTLARQDEFLLRAGLLDQLERLTADAPNEAERAALRLDAREMVLPGGMSESFQVLVQKKISPDESQS